MNQHSVLCRFLSEHPEDWETRLLKDYSVRVKKDGTYAIFNYSFGSVFSDPVVQESRGIILDTETLEVVCWPFRKFGNHNESYADPIDWSTARVLEKVDGSIIKLWFDRKQNIWQFSTNGTIRSDQARVGESAALCFGELIRSAENYHDIPFDTLDKDLTYIFELVSPESQVVVPYSRTSLYHTGTRSNVTGEEMELSIGIQKPASYPIGSLSECIRKAVELNRNAGEEILAEGFVVVDGRWNRVKVKSPDYIARHQLVQMKSISKRECVTMLLSGSEDLQTICQANPELIPVVKFYDYHISRLCHVANRMGNLARQLYEEYSQDRAAVAGIISRHPLAFVGFRCIQGEKKGSEYLMELNLERLCRMIPDYEEEDFSALFL